MRIEQHVVQAPKLRLLIQRLFLEDIQSRTRNPSRFERLNQLFLVTSATSTNVHENSALFHESEGVLVIKEGMSLRHLWKHSNYEISFLDYISVAFEGNNLISVSFLLLIQTLRIPFDANYFHIESLLTYLGHGCPNISITNDHNLLLTHQLYRLW